MFALRQKVAESSAPCDISSALARVLKHQKLNENNDSNSAGSVAGSCQDALRIIEEAQIVLSEASRSVRKAAAHVIDAASADDAERALLAEKYDDARRQVEAAMGAAPEGAASLLRHDAERLSVHLTGAVYAIAPFPLTTDEFGLDLPPPQHGFVSHAEVADTLRRVEIALERIGRAKAIYDEDAAFLRRRAARG